MFKKGFGSCWRIGFLVLGLVEDLACKSLRVRGWDGGGGVAGRWKYLTGLGGGDWGCCFTYRIGEMMGFVLVLQWMDAEEGCGW